MLKRIAILLACGLVGFCIGKTQAYFDNNTNTETTSSEHTSIPDWLSHRLFY